MPTISIYLSDEDIQQLEEMGKAENRNNSNLISTLIRNAYKRFFADSEHLVAGPDQLPLPLEE